MKLKKNRMTMFVPEQERPVDLKDNERALPA